MKLTELAPKPDQRLMIVGASGSGKTTLARTLLPYYDRVLVIDPKCTYGGPEGEPGYRMVRSPRALRGLSKKEARIQFRPDVDYQDVASYDQVYEWAYRQGNILIYTDEVYLVMHGSRSPVFLDACLTCGRELGVGMINASQRPAGITRKIYTESDRMACFRLRNRDDVKRMSEAMGEEVMRRPEGHGFWYLIDGWRKPVLLQLKLGDKRNG